MQEIWHFTLTICKIAGKSFAHSQGLSFWLSFPRKSALVETLSLKGSIHA
jgi:hypothetical protein